jgi:hypothetical protein
MSDPAVTLAWKVAEPVITRWQNLTATKGSSLYPADWDAFFADLKAGGLFAGDMAHPGWAPAQMKRCERKADGVQSLCALVLDYDAGTTIDDAAALWAPYFGLIHSSRKHKPEAHRFRTVLPLSRSVTPVEHGRVWAWAARKAERAGHKIDAATKDPARFWFWPGVAQGGTFETRDLSGKPIDVDAVLAEHVDDEIYRNVRETSDPLPTYAEAGPRTIDLESRIKRASRYVERMPAAISGSGGHQATWAVAQVLIRGFDLPIPDAYSILADFNQRCDPPWNERELRHKLDDAERASKVPRGYGARSDGYQNLITGLGTYAYDKTMGGSMMGLSFNILELGSQDCLYRWRGSDLGARIVEAPPNEMTREGWDLIIQPTEDDGDEAGEPSYAQQQDAADDNTEITEAIEGQLDELGAFEQLLLALQYERAFGGAAILLNLDDGRELTEPVDEGSLRRIVGMRAFYGGRDGDGAEEFGRETVPLAGVSDILQQFALRLAAAADMPATLVEHLDHTGDMAEELENAQRNRGAVDLIQAQPAPNGDAR